MRKEESSSEALELRRAELVERIITEFSAVCSPGQLYIYKTFAHNLAFLADDPTAVEVKSGLPPGEERRPILTLEVQEVPVRFEFSLEGIALSYPSAELSFPGFSISNSVAFKTKDGPPYLIFELFKLSRGEEEKQEIMTIGFGVDINHRVSFCSLPMSYKEANPLLRVMSRY